MDQKVSNHITNRRYFSFHKTFIFKCGITLKKLYQNILKSISNRFYIKYDPNKFISNSNKIFSYQSQNQISSGQQIINGAKPCETFQMAPSC